MTYQEVVLLVQDMHKNFSPDCENFSPTVVASENTESIQSQMINYHKTQRQVTVEIRSIELSNKLLGYYRPYCERNKTTGTYGDMHVIIPVRNDLNECWKRFIVTKELTHIIINPPGSKNVVEEIIDDIRSLTSWAPMTVGVGMNGGDAPLSSEEAALYFAAELLVPYCHNDYLVDSSVDPYHIADHFKVPEKLINMMRDVDYQKRRKKAYQ